MGEKIGRKRGGERRRDKRREGRKERGRKVEKKKGGGEEICRKRDKLSLYPSFLIYKN